MTSLLDNQIIGGGLVLMLTGAVMGLLRKVPGALYESAKRRFSVSLTILDTDPLFEWTKLWLDSLPYSRRARNISCSLYRDPEQDFSTDSRALFAPAHGDHFFVHRHKFVWLSRNKSEATSSPNGAVAASRTPEAIRLTVLGTKQESVRELVAEIISSARELEQQKVRGYISGCGWWRRLSSFSPRRIETVDVPREDERRITDTIRRFLASRSEYVRRGIPYHLNFLFAGLPGTGKTSLASALCGHFGLNLHILNIAGPGMNDDRLVELMLSLPRRSLLLLEDVDAVVPERKQKPKAKSQTNASSTPIAKGESSDEGVTLSGLLNCMDGLTAPEGAVIIMTTNHPELLDAALLRPGRVDMRVDFCHATREQIERMARRLNPRANLNGAVDSMLMQKYTTAEVQAELLKSVDH